MLTLKQKLSAIPEGAGALFFIQIFATLGFAVLYSTLVLYATGKLNFSVKEATAIMGVFGAFNYGLHLFGGYLGGRFISNRNLFVGGMVLQVIGCASIAGGTAALLYWGLAFFLTGSGLNVTCLNLMLTQRFKPEDNRRESAFLWNYAGMNLASSSALRSPAITSCRATTPACSFLRRSAISWRSCWRRPTGKCWPT